MRRWAGLIQIYNELPENLPRAVRSMRRICDYIVGYDDGSTDGSREWMRANLDFVIESDTNDWKAEIEHKSLMLEHLRERASADWILWLDADEELSPPAVAALRRLEHRTDITGITIPEINLWLSEDYYRVDRGFGDAGFLRAWRMRPELRYHSTERGHHQPQFPPAARERMAGLTYPTEPIIHYSWSTLAKLRAKYARYASHGQSGDNLERINEDPNAQLVPVDPSWFWPQEA